MTEIENLLMDHYEDMRKHAFPDLDVTHAGYRVLQTFAYSDEHTYMRRVFDTNGKLILCASGEYMTEEDLMEWCETLDLFFLGLERIE